MGLLNNYKPEKLFTFEAADSYPYELTEWHVINWDQRRRILVTVAFEREIDEDLDEEFGTLCQALGKVVGDLDDDVNLLKFSKNFDLISASSDPTMDIFNVPLYCPVNMIPKKYQTGRVISRKDLVEVDRLKTGVDLVTYRFEPKSTAVFKYGVDPQQAPRNWRELNCWLRVSEHPNVVPFEYIITDFQDVPRHGTDMEVVVGFTSTFIPGGTFEDNRSRDFKLKYLEQLIEVVDDLNLKFGIVHADITRRNIVINPTTDTLQLFDFNVSLRANSESGKPDPPRFTRDKIDVNSVVATVYEIITGDSERAAAIIEHGEPTSTVTRMKWVKRPDVCLDAGISSYQRTLRCWLRRRNRPLNRVRHFKQAQSPLEEWPQPWAPKIPAMRSDGSLITSWDDAGTRSSVDVGAMRALGLKFVTWERPAHNRIPEGFRVLADGTLVAQADLDGDAQGHAVGSRSGHRDQLALKGVKRRKGRAPGGDV
ncbi:hypothetical protein DHEL01_v212653 [Diaporthe helianthi]|uniref:non-specific serine/threonine protein kinase n=1 Tax=Diaporthe helianthi TaxID=158607 RepID=A0A2P5HFC1_DIAHE|nr:hypothetical protein DHEL01_v212653 [Diaporthe helianthi]